MSADRQPMHVPLDSTVDTSAGTATVELRSVDNATLDDYAAFCRRAVHGPAQHPLWLRSWIMASNPDVVIVVLRRQEQPVIQLPLEVVRMGPFNVARFVGGRHANGNFVASVRDTTAVSAADARLLVRVLRQARPDIDVIELQRQNPSYDGTRNPFADLATVRSPNVSLAVELSGGFEAVLERSGARSKKKKYRRQLRKFERAGGYRLLQARTPDEVERLLSEFFVMKAARFQANGISDIFGSDEVQKFFTLLFTTALAQTDPPFVVHGLEVAGRIIGVNGLSVTPTSFVSEIGAIRVYEPGWSPGFFLDYTAIEQACSIGKELYDLSVGDEPYKRSWCDVETWQFDTLLPLTLRGRAASIYRRGRTRLVGYVKSSPALWEMIKDWRARILGSG